MTKDHGLIDWSRKAVEICNHIRAMQPWPTAYTFLHRKGQPPTRMIILRATWEHVNKGSDAPPVEPGNLWSLNLPEPRGPMLLVDTGSWEYVVHILELQPAGKRRMTAADFLRGHPLQPGDRFGPEQL